MGTKQRVEILGVLILVFAAMLITAVGALGLVNFQVPPAVGGVWSAVSDILTWVRLALVAVVAARMWLRRSTEAE